MKKNTEYIIPYEGLKTGNHRFNYEITDTFFESFKSEKKEQALTPVCDFHDMQVNVTVDIMKDVTMLILEFKHEGTTQVTCDRCLAEIPQQVEANNKLIVKFGESREDDNDSIITLPEGEYEIDLAPFIYDYICLSFPWRFDCSELKESEKPCDEEVLKKIALLQNNKNKDSDPRWDALRKLK